MSAVGRVMAVSIKLVCYGLHHHRVHRHVSVTTMQDTLFNTDLLSLHDAVTQYAEVMQCWL